MRMERTRYLPLRTLGLRIAGEGACATLLLIFAGIVALADEPALTIYNKGFGVVREIVHLNLQSGRNNVNVGNLTSRIEPDSVILRDPAGGQLFRILEQNYRKEVASQDLLLKLNEGNTLDFLADTADGTRIVPAKIIRSGYPVTGPQQAAAWQYGVPSPTLQPIVEAAGHERFGLPGTPLFPGLPSDALLTPALNWTLDSDSAGPVDAELAYLTWGMGWYATYNMVLPKEGDTLDLTAWVTMQNATERTFENAHVKLLAGTVNKLVEAPRRDRAENRFTASPMAMDSLSSLGYISARQTVVEKTFDEFHLYTVDHPVTIHHDETKQVAFAVAHGVKVNRFYFYDGGQLTDAMMMRGGVTMDPSYGVQSIPDVIAKVEIENTKDNKLGIPLPEGGARIYRRDDNGELDLIGQSTVKHTPRDEPVKLSLGTAFDLVGERKRTEFTTSGPKGMTESYEIRLHNHKNETVEIRVVEHMGRSANWELTKYSDPFLKRDSHTAEFRVQVKPNAERVITYQVAYTW